MRTIDEKQNAKNQLLFLPVRISGFYKFYLRLIWLNNREVQYCFWSHPVNRNKFLESHSWALRYFSRWVLEFSSFLSFLFLKNLEDIILGIKTESSCILFDIHTICTFILIYPLLSTGWNFLFKFWICGENTITLYIRIPLFVFRSHFGNTLDWFFWNLNSKALIRFIPYPSLSQFIPVYPFSFDSSRFSLLSFGKCFLMINHHQNDKVTYNEEEYFNMDSYLLLLSQTKSRNFQIVILATKWPHNSWNSKE